MTREFDVVVEHDSEGYYVASVPALPDATPRQNARRADGAH